MADMLAMLKMAAPSIQDHVRSYIETDGGDAAYFRDNTQFGGDPKTTHLLLKTFGRKTGEPRFAPLIFKEIGGEYVIVASKAGDDSHPTWFLNMRDAKEVAAQVGPKRYRCTWRVAEGEERQRIWDVMTPYYPPYLEYQARTDRQIPVVLLRPVGEIAEKFVSRPGDGVDARTRVPS